MTHDLARLLIALEHLADIAKAAEAWAELSDCLGAEEYSELSREADAAAHTLRQPWRRGSAGARCIRLRRCASWWRSITCACCSCVPYANGNSSALMTTAARC